MKVSSRKEPQALIITISGRMDATTAPYFQSECGEWMMDGEKKMIIDCSRLEYISSAGLREILGLGKALKAGGGFFGLCRISGMVKDVLEISGFLNIFPVFDTVEEALAAV